MQKYYRECAKQTRIESERIKQGKINKKEEIKEVDKEITRRNFVVSTEMGEDSMERLMENKVLGLRDFRSNVSEVFQRAINSFEEIIIGNAKRGGKTVSIISTDLLESILENYKFNPLISYDEVSKQYEVIIKEISVTGFGDTKEDAINMIVENTIVLVEDYFENLELYLRLADMKCQYPYYLRLRHCETSEDIVKIMNLDK